jgi:hypothetical protein
MVLAPICAAMMYLPSIGMERALYIRERNDGLYRPVTYLLFKLLDELLMMAPVTAATTAAVFYACKLQGSYLLFWLVQYATLANGTGDLLRRYLLYDSLQMTCNTSHQCMEAYCLNICDMPHGNRTKWCDSCVMGLDVLHPFSSMLTAA